MINSPLKVKYIFILILTVFLSSCFEIIEEVNVNDDGSGRLSYTLNLSQSRTKINSISILDSLNGHKIPDENDIRLKISEVLHLIEKTDGISNVSEDLNFQDYIFKFSCEFSDSYALNEATKIVKSAYEIEDPNSNSDDHFTFDETNKSFRRKGDYKGEADLDKVKEDDLSMLKNAEFTGIYRFQSEIKSASNSVTRISPNRKAAMMKFKVIDLINKKENIENTITLK